MSLEQSRPQEKIVSPSDALALFEDEHIDWKTFQELLDANPKSDEDKIIPDGQKEEEK